MSLSVSEMHRGMTILYEGELYEIIEYEHSKRGRGGAMARTKLRHLETGRVISTTFKGQENTEAAFLESRQIQFLYKEADRYIFMDSEHFDQFPVPMGLLGTQGSFIVEGINAIGYFYNGRLVKVEAPNFVELKVVHTEPGVKGDTVSNVEKSATIEGGTVIQVPLFVKEGDTLKVDTRSGEYVERV